ncbi:MAG: polyprenol monophosphomannose synthase [Dehalococcoidia bacterium]|jgi:dolichol-phosphate mannosyltransferase|nr:polyprenol monophosphomannose synthase [Dehalococcoidia bacterium]MDP7085540.1 polyprenol monophosphomannose synthase [Dehalococcoidia bacterium]MDP7202283.1 polyprenol monophosphomannose synthase [Dehalococcoidia bacterium]HJN88398.1 polyprenol monophosphomannose synthase [Dehalococcoidia bacterium]
MGELQVTIVLPTYNERENIPELFEGIADALNGRWTYEIIVVDDNSPDGTAGAVRSLAGRYPAVRLLERPHKAGLARAIAAGFGMAKGEHWVMMDADLSHRPPDLAQLLEGLSRFDIVIGSRYIEGGRIVGWSFHRRVASRLAAAVGRLWLGLSVRDVTSGFVAFRKEAIAPLLPSLEPKGFKLLLEILVRARTARVLEAPISFVERQHGRSKFSGGEVVAFLRLCLRLRRR